MHVKLSVVKLSLTQAALTSHGLDEHGFGTVLEREKLIVSYIYSNHQPSQLVPLASNGGMHVHVKLSVVTLSLTQAALVSHGLDEHGFGTVLEREK